MSGLPHAYVRQGLESWAGTFNQPIANRTRLGWVLHGKHIGTSSTNEYTIVTHKEVREEASMNKIIEYLLFRGRIWSTKLSQTAKPLISKQNERAEKIMNDTLHFRMVNMKLV